MTVQKRVLEHLAEAKTLIPEQNIVGIFLQGSQNYGLSYAGSDVDTKCITTPVLYDLCRNRKPLSTTHVRANEEHIDLKDIRLYVDTFRKQNLNFLEILWTPYYSLNPLYQEQWERLVKDREVIARMNPLRAVKSMYGIAMEKYHALKHPYPSKVEILAKYGFDPKQLHHLLRVEEYLRRYINGEEYGKCLVSEQKDYLLAVKTNAVNYSEEEADKIALTSIENTTHMVDKFKELHPKEEVDTYADELLTDVGCQIIEISLKNELKEG